MTAGIAASTAYLAMQAVDRRLLRHSYDDLLLWGGFFAREQRRQRLLGLTVHYTLGTLLAAVYGRLQAALPVRSAVLRAVLFVQVENAALYPGVPLINAVHPLVRTGKLPSLRTWRYFWIEVARHAAYGAVLGKLMDDGAISAGRDA